MFFSAAQKQMDKLTEDGLVVEGTRRNVVNNQLVVISRKDSGTEVTGLKSLEKAQSAGQRGISWSLSPRMRPKRYFGNIILTRMSEAGFSGAGPYECKRRSDINDS